ncbi:MAG: hypothetical protein ACI4VX_04390, partial [Succinivibrionaceae bacterium]
YNKLITTKEVFSLAIIKQFDKRSGITYVYDSKSYYDKEKKCSRAKRTLIGKIDPDTGEMIPTDGRNKGARSKPNTVSPEINKDKRIQELEDENRQLKLQISALKKEIERIQNSK